MCVNIKHLYVITHHTEVQVLLDPFLPIFKLVVETHYVEGVQGVYYRSPQLGITCRHSAQTGSVHIAISTQH